MKPIKCTVIVNTKWGYCSTSYEAKSISEGVKYAKSSGGFAYRVLVNGKVVRRGFCDPW